jgi:hypothetical protein
MSGRPGTAELFDDGRASVMTRWNSGRLPYTVSRGITVGHARPPVGESVATSTTPEVFSLIEPPRRVNNAHGHDSKGTAMPAQS